METQQKFLSFHLGLKDTAVIPLQHIVEVFQISLMEICAVPHMPNCVVGTYNWRGEMLWVVDLEEMLGYTPATNKINLSSKLMAIVLKCEGKSLGLLVRQLMDIELLDIRQIKYPESHVFSENSPFLQGYFLSQSEDMMLSLDTSAIVQSSLWKN